jgi:hypothetical protein
VQLNKKLNKKLMPKEIVDKMKRLPSGKVSSADANSGVMGSHNNPGNRHVTVAPTDNKAPTPRNNPGGRSGRH